MNLVKLLIRITLTAVSIFALFSFTFTNLEEIEGWSLRGSAPGKYKIGVEYSPEQGGKVGFIKSTDNEITTKKFGTIVQSFIPKSYLGKKVKLTAIIQSKNVKGWAGMWMRVDGERRKTLSFDNMQDRAIKGTTGWKKYEIILDVPKESINISYGVLLAGQGAVWMDNFTFQIVGKASPKKAKKTGIERTKPTNTGFDN